MTFLRVLIIVALFLLTSCTSFGLFDNSPEDKPSFTDPPAGSLLADTQRLVPDRFPFVLIVLVLGFMIRYITSRGRHPRKLYRLSDQEIALVGLASDTLSDLWRLLRAKRRSNIIPFPR